MSEAPLPETKPSVPGSGVTGLPTLNLNALMRQALPSGSTAHIQPTIEKLRTIQAEKNAALTPVRQGIVDRAAENREAVIAKRDAIEPIDVQPWTQKRPENDPIRSFGSFGSVFAQIASAFTNQPMVNALEGSAAAMNAMRTNDIAAYKDAYQAWQDNTTLALKRHDIQRQEYQDALKLMETDMAGGQAQLTMLAAKYGDDAVAAMNEAGLYKEMNQVFEGRQRAALGLLGVMPRLQEMGQEQQLLMSDPDWRSGDPEKMRAAYQRTKAAMSPFTLAASDPKRIAMQTYLSQHPNATAEEIAAFNRSLTATGAKVSPFDAALNAIRAREGIEVGAETPQMVAEAQNIANTGGKSGDPKRIAMQRFMVENPNATSEQIAEFTKKLSANAGGFGNSLTGRVLEIMTRGATSFADNAMTPEQEQEFMSAVTQYTAPQNAYDPTTGQVGLVQKQLPAFVAEALRRRGFQAPAPQAGIPVIQGDSQIAPMQPQQPAGSAPVPVAPASRSAMPANVDFSQGTGVSGAVGRVANIVTDALGMPLAAPETEKAIQALEQLNAVTVTTLQDAVPGRPSNYLMEQLNRLAVEPASILSGDRRSMDRLVQTKTLLSRAINEIDDALTNPRQFSQKQLNDAREKKLQLRSLLDDYVDVVVSFQRNLGVGPRRPLSEFEKK